MRTEAIAPKETEDARDLIQRITESDGDAFERLYDRYAQVMLNLAFRIVGNQADAEDVVQEVFCQVWRDAARYDPARGVPDAWLFTLARTRALDLLRVSRRAPKESADLLVEVAENSECEDDDPLARRMLNAAFHELGEEQRQTLELAYFEGLTQAQIAARVGAPLGTVKSWGRRGLERMRDTLVENGWTAS
ncbi:MAG: sigma-70 family RNA polymerase sigma factor [Gammaproteobacteria bacterium]